MGDDRPSRGSGARGSAEGPALTGATAGRGRAWAEGEIAGVMRSASHHGGRALSAERDRLVPTQGRLALLGAARCHAAARPSQQPSGPGSRLPQRTGGCGGTERLGSQLQVTQPAGGGSEVPTPHSLAPEFVRLSLSPFAPTKKSVWLCRPLTRHVLRPPCGTRGFLARRPAGRLQTCLNPERLLTAPPSCHSSARCCRPLGGDRPRLLLHMESP